MGRTVTRSGLSPADRVTLTRAVLGVGVAVLVLGGLVGIDPDTPLLVGLAAVALALDAVDGPVARRTGTVSERGARFDMETDAALLLVLSVHAATLLGAWVLLIGLARYAYGAAGLVYHWLPGPLPVRRSAKVVAAVQGVVLVVVAAGVLPVWAATVLVAAALGALAWSFAVSVEYRWARR